MAWLIMMCSLLIFMHPKVTSAKKNQGISLPRALVVTFWVGLTGGEIKKKHKARNAAAEKNVSDEKKNARVNLFNTGATGQTSVSLGDIKVEKQETQADTLLFEEEQTGNVFTPSLGTDDFIENPTASEIAKSQETETSHWSQRTRYKQWSE